MTHVLLNRPSNIEDIFTLMPLAMPVHVYKGDFSKAQLHLTIGYTSREDKEGYAATIATLRKYGRHIRAVAIIDTGLGWSIEALFEDDHIGGAAVSLWNSFFA